MRDEIIKIANQLEKFEITEQEAYHYFLDLFKIDKPRPRCRLSKHEICYRPHGGNCRSLNCENFY